MKSANESGNVAATDRYSLIVESATRGEAELRRFEQTMNRVADVVERSQKRVGDGSRTVSDDTRQFAANLKNFLSNPLQAAGDAHAEVHEAAAAHAGVGVVARIGDEIDELTTDACRHKWPRSRPIFLQAFDRQPQHVAVEADRAVEIADAENEVVEPGNRETHRRRHLRIRGWRCRGGPLPRGGGNGPLYFRLRAFPDLGGGVLGAVI